MSILKYELQGNRGRSIKIYDRKVEIKVDVTAGSILTGNATDGIKTIFYTDVIGFQYKEPGAAIGYLQFETASGQMNNQKSSFFSENTFTFEYKKGVTTDIIEEIIHYIKDTLEIIKYGSISLEGPANNQDSSNTEANMNMELTDLPEL